LFAGFWFVIFLTLKAMNSIFKKDGLSARQRAIEHSRKWAVYASRLAKKLIFLFALFAVGVAFSSCRDKTSGQDQAHLKNDAAAASDTLDKPKVNIRVNRRYDDKGNLVGLDSTYSSFYSNVQGDTSRMDSLMKSFDRYFDQRHSLLFDRQFNRLFFNDTSRYPDFFHHDYFMKRYELNDPYLRDMMHRMDSVKNRFYREHAPGQRAPADL